MNTTITKDKITILTKKGIKELKKSISQLECDRHKAIHVLKELEKTIGREERLERIEKLADLETIESELQDKKLILSTARQMPSTRSKMRVAIGSVVDLIDRRGRRFRYKIVETVEADPSRGLISNISPIGKNLIGKTVQDFIDWKNGKFNERFYLAKIH